MPRSRRFCRTRAPDSSATLNAVPRPYAQPRTGNEGLLCDMFLPSVQLSGGRIHHLVGRISFFDELESQLESLDTLRFTFRNKPTHLTFR